MNSLIATRISTKELTFEPGGAPAEFDVTVVNHSDRFATFQMEVQAAGADTTAGRTWYRLLPEICTKKPPGDSTQFSVQVTDLPRPGFVGLMNLTVRVFSLDLQDAENRQVLRLVVPGAGVMPPEVKLPLQAFTGEPGDRLKIPVSVSNFNRQSVNVTLRMLGLDASWFPEGTEQRVQLSPSGEADLEFWCQLPTIAAAPTGTYPFTLEATQPQAPIVQVQGTVTVSAQGWITFRCRPEVQQLPPTGGGWRSLTADSAEYRLTFENRSNHCPTLRAEVVEQAPIGVQWGDRWRATWLQWRSQPLTRPLNRQDLLNRMLNVVPESVALGLGESQTLSLKVPHRRPWLGRVRHKRFTATAIADRSVEIHHNPQPLELKIQPRLPFWLQVGGGLAALLLLGWALSYLWRWQHTAPVNSVRLTGLVGEVVSAADDQTVQRWQVEGDQLRSRGILGKATKAVRVARYRPLNNDQVAVGYENGELQVWNLLSPVSLPAFAAQADDRVFDLVFTPDAQSLFSGHGSGQVLQWNLDPDGKVSPGKPFRSQQVGFAVNALALVGAKQQHLAIGGRYNQLRLWDLQTNRLQAIATGANSERHYMLSLATATQKPDLLATADNQGTIKLWNLRPCLTGKADCELRDEWTADKRAIRSVALSQDGCYLASAGDDGQIKLWSLNATGDRRSEDTAGRVVRQSGKPLNSVDLRRVQDELWLASGGDDYQVNLDRVQHQNSECR